MASISIEYHSQVLGMERQVKVIYPDQSELDESSQGDTDIPVLYLLHGMGGNENSWQKRTNIERLVRHTNLIIVMPSTDLGWYTDTTYGMDYTQATFEELPQVLSSFFPNMTTKRDKSFVAGLSMGGYGAFKWALTSNRFSKAAFFSGALDFSVDDLLEEVLENRAYWEGIFGNLERNLEKHSLTSMLSQFDGKTDFYA
ncbi:putative esterase [Streptococcus ictaluri 707-05]|uniref:Esterase n=1 Tax=Streptococcus ictaluri 707-05 TaxID=764299 RepID=G5K2H0_9STRE|nr:putative esterase [Streptococcus ictaluri 707-05]